MAASSRHGRSPVGLPARMAHGGRAQRPGRTAQQSDERQPGQPRRMKAGT
ncbi:MAG: hypothetical protein LBE67_05000 [Kocuria palustris]|nr:hypothetical protein [Kocuria palustris]